MFETVAIYMLTTIQLFAAAVCLLTAWALRVGLLEPVSNKRCGGRMYGAPNWKTRIYGYAVWASRAVRLAILLLLLLTALRGLLLAAIIVLGA